jgi:hypothetical protein
MSAGILEVACELAFTTQVPALALGAGPGMPIDDS